MEVAEKYHNITRLLDPHDIITDPDKLVIPFFNHFISLHFVDHYSLMFGYLAGMLDLFVNLPSQGHSFTLLKMSRGYLSLLEVPNGIG
jgi:hypothetical protein